MNTPETMNTPEYQLNQMEMVKRVVAKAATDPDLDELFFNRLSEINPRFWTSVEQQLLLLDYLALALQSSITERNPQTVRLVDVAIFRIPNAETVLPLVRARTFALLHSLPKVYSEIARHSKIDEQLAEEQRDRERSRFAKATARR